MRRRRERIQATLAVRQTNRGPTATECVDNKLGSFWVMCTGPKGCCQRSNCSWFASHASSFCASGPWLAKSHNRCKDNTANKRSHSRSIAPLAASSQLPPPSQSQSSASPRGMTTILRTLAPTASPSPSSSSFSHPELLLSPLELLPPLPSPPPAPDHSRKGGAALALPLGVVFGAVLPMVFIAAVLFVRRRRHNHSALSPSPPPPPPPPPPPLPPGFLGGLKRPVSSGLSWDPPPTPAYVKRERGGTNAQERGSVARVVELGEADTRAELP